MFSVEYHGHFLLQLRVATAAPISSTMELHLLIITMVVQMSPSSGPVLAVFLGFSAGLTLGCLFLVSVCVCVCSMDRVHVCVYKCAHVWINFHVSVLYTSAFPGTSPHIETLSAPDQHAFEVVPQNCMGNSTKTLLRRIEVPAETCVQPFSIT